MKEVVINQEEIAEGLKNGSAEEVKYLYKTVKPKIAQFIKERKGIESDVHDIFQVALMSVRNKLLEGVEITYIETYLHKSCINEWNSINERKKNEVADTENINNPSHHGFESPFEETDEEARMSKFFRAFQKLKSECRKLFKLKSDKIPYSEIALLMGITEEFVKTKKRRCKKYFMKIFNNLNDNE